MTLDIKLKLDRPETGVDTVVELQGDWTPANAKVIATALEGAASNFENETDDTVFEVEGSITEGEDSLTVAGKAKKSTILRFIQVSQEMNQTYVPDPPVTE